LEAEHNAVGSGRPSTTLSNVRHRFLARARTKWPPYVLAPGLALLVLKISNNVLLQAGGLDAYIYTSFIQNYTDLVNRYGLTYYSARIAHLYPAGLIVALFGTEHGYFAYRYLLICTALGAVWALARKHYSAPVAFLAVTCAGCHPWLLRSLFWDHYDSSGVMYLLLATALLGSAESTNWRRVFLSGGAYAFAANCNTFLLGVGAILFASYLVVNVRPRPRDWLHFGVISVSGFLAFYLPLCAIHYRQFPNQGLFFDLTVFRFARSMLAGVGQQWHNDVVKLVENGWVHLLAPAIVLAAVGVLVIVRGGRQKPVVSHAGLNLALVIALYLIVDFVYKVAVISLFYYFIYLFPATLFCTIALIGELAEGVAEPVRSIVLYSCGILAPAAYAAYPHWAPLILRLNRRWLAVPVLLAFSGAALVNRYAKVGLALVALAVVASPIAFYKMPVGIYSAIYEGSPRQEWDVYRAAIELQHTVSQYPPSNGAAGFWYTNRAGSMLNSVQSMYLWGFSRLASPNDPKAGMPVLTKADLAKIPSFRYLYLLSEQNAEIEQGERTLDAAGVKTRVLGQESYDGTKFNMRCVVLERLNVAPPK
jgi:hypothetical protein